MNKDELLRYKGLKSLSPEERSTWEIENKERFAKINSLSYKDREFIKSQVYLNDLYKEEFGKEEFAKNPDFESRRLQLLNKKVKDIYGADSNYSRISNLTEEGLYKLVESTYNSPEEYVDKYAKYEKEYNAIKDDVELRTQWETPEAFGAYMTQKNAETLDAIYKEDLQRKAADTSVEAAAYSDNFYRGLKSGEISHEYIDKLFNDLTQGTEYTLRKDSKEFTDFNQTDKIQYLSKMMGLMNKYGEEDAVNLLGADLQNYAQEHMSGGQKITNLWREFYTSVTSEAMNEVLALRNAWNLVSGDLEELDANLNGKTKEGEDLKNIWNPQYWQSVKQYNTHSADEIDKIRQSGGITPYKNITKAGDEYEIFNLTNIGNSLAEGVGQAAVMAAQAALFKGVGIGTSSVLGTTGKATSFAARAIAATEIGLSSLGGAHAESYEAYQNTTLEAKEKIDKYIDAKVQARVKEHIKTPEFTESFNSLLETKKRLAKEQGKMYLDENVLMQETYQEYVSNLSKNYKQFEEQSEEVQKLKEEATSAALTAYGTALTISTLKNAGANAALRKAFLSKGTQKQIDDIFGGEVPKTTIKADGSLQAGKFNWYTKNIRPYTKPFFGEGADEWLDVVINNGAQNFGMAGFNDYLSKEVDPDNYNEVLDNGFHHLLKAFADLPEDVFTKEALFEAGMGAFSGALRITPNIGLVFDKNREIRGQSFKTDAKGNKISLAEALNKYVSNEMLQEKADVNRRGRDYTAAIDAANATIDKHKSDLELIGKTISTLSDYNNSDASTLEVADGKSDNIIKLAFIINDLESGAYTSMSPTVQEGLSRIEKMVSGNLTEEETNSLIDEFLANPANKSIAQEDNAREKALERLQDNAKSFQATRETIRTRYKELNEHRRTRNISDYAKKQIIFTELQEDNWIRRQVNMSEELGISNTRNIGTESVSVLGSRGAFYREYNSMNKAMEELTVHKKSLQETIDNLKTKYETATKEERAVLDLTLKMTEGALVQTESTISRLSLDMGNYEKNKSYFDNDEFSETLSVEQILNLSVQERARILDKRFYGDYSVEQKLIIDDAKRELIRRDPNALEKINDMAILADRIRASEEARANMYENPEYLSSYIAASQKYRENRMKDSAYERAKTKVLERLEPLNDEQLVEATKNLSPDAIELFTEAHPEKKELLSPILEFSKFRRDASNTIFSMYNNKSDRGALSTIVNYWAKDAQSSEEYMSSLEDALDSEFVDPLKKAEIKKLLTSLEQVGYQRDATKVQSRKERQEAKKKAEEQETLRLEEERIRKEEELKKAEKEAPIPTVEQYDEASKTDITLEGEEEAFSENIEEQSKDYTDEEVEAFFKEKEDLRRADRETYNNIPENVRHKIDELSHKALEYSMGITKDSSEEVKNADRRKTINELIESAKGTPYESIVNKHFKYYTSKSKVKEETTNLETSSITEPTEETPIITTPKIEPEIIEDNSSTSLQGSRFWRYDLTPMKYEGKQVLMQGSEEEDSMNTLFKWLESLGGNYQDIIDHELSRIMKLNPDVHMMMSNDREVWEHMFEVIEYTDKVKRIHPENKGNIISSNDKQWLVIGVVGFGNKEQQRAYYSIKDALKAERGSRPDDRFVVSEKYKTKIEHLHNGYITRALEGEEVTFRTLTELTSDPKRNPKNLGIEDLKWGIITPEGMLQINTSERLDIASPKDISGNIGNVFLLVESASGKYIPIYMKPVRYGELRDGELKTEIDSYINELSSPIYKERKEAYDKLAQRLVFNTDNDIIIEGENNNVISIKKDGIVVKTFDLNNPEFNRSEFIETVKSIDARINVNKSVLSDPYLVQKYDDAGAFLTDIAKLATSNSGFSVYSMDKDTGEPNIPSEPNPHLIRPSSDYNRKQEHSVFYLGKTYRELNGEFKQEGTDKVITDPITLEQLRLLQTVKQLTPVFADSHYDYYILSSDVSNPKACRVDSRPEFKKIEMLPKEQSLKLIEQSKEKAIKEAQQEALDNITVSTEEAPLTAYEEAVKSKEPKLEPESKEEVKTDINTITSDSVVQEEKTSYYVGDILKDVDYGETLDEIINEKLEKGDWEDSEGKLNSVQGTVEYLKNKGIQIFGIIDVNSWLEMVRECK